VLYRRSAFHWIAIALLVVASCDASSSAETSNSQLPDLTTVEISTTSPVAAPSSSTTTPVVVATTEATNATTPPLTPTQFGVDTASRLATAFADGDWTTARSLSPLPAWSDQTYKDGFAGLESATIFEANTITTDEGMIDMWLAQVAHESTGGEHTTLYCVHWRFDPSLGTIERVSGKEMSKVPGFVNPADLQDEGIAECARFEQPAAPVTTVLELPPLPITPGARNEPNLDGGSLITFNGRDYVCFSKMFGSDVDCVRYFGGDASRPFFGSQDLWCTERFSDLECTEDGYYPSNLDGYDVMTIDGQRALCQFDECWLWPDYVNDPGSVPFGPPDYECDLYGRCSAA
jgi:hypothetical protein